MHQPSIDFHASNERAYEGSYLCIKVILPLGIHLFVHVCDKCISERINDGIIIAYYSVMHSTGYSRICPRCKRLVPPYGFQEPVRICLVCYAKNHGNEGLPIEILIEKAKASKFARR